MRRALGLLVMLIASAPGYATSWADLWSRPEQRTIAQRQQALTEIQAQQFAAAAARLQPLGDPESQYNRGNALARGGDLKGALQAYEQLLKSGAGDAALRQDATHNRDLVAKQLEQQGGQSQGKPGDKSGQPGDKSQQESKSGQAADKSGQQGNSAGTPGAGSDDKSGRAGEQANRSQDTRDASSQSGKEAGAAKQAQSSDPSGRQAGQQAAQRAAAEAEKSSEGGSKEQKSAQAQAHGGGQEGDRRQAKNGPQVPQERENAESMEQWLRWIPDDPSGLLRRKFMIEHMLQQRQESP